MLFVAGATTDFRVMLLTRHIPLAEVPQALNIDKTVDSTLSLHNSLINDFKISNPKIAICGLNPHAGEDGLFGNEEQQIIIPAINKLKNISNIDIKGAFPADTVW